MLQYIKIPKDRIAVLIGSNGETKKIIEKRMNSILNIDSNNGIVEIKEGKSPLSYIKGIDVIKAISRGFSPQKAYILFDNEDTLLEIIDLSNIIKNRNEMIRLKGRIIGKNGRTREIAEELINCKISIYGKTISIIGNPEQNSIIKIMIQMFINGVNHSIIYRFLEKKHRELTKKIYDI